MGASNMEKREYKENKIVLDMLNRYFKDLEGNEAQVLISDIKQAFLELPSVDVTPVVHGEWIGMDVDQCSICKHYLNEIMDADSFYAIGFNPNQLVACPFCGAKMDGGK